MGTAREFRNFCVLRRTGRLALAAGAIGLSLITTAIAQQKFDTAEGAADALVQASRQDDRRTLLTILGQGAADILSSGDRVSDETRRKIFVAAYDIKHNIKTDGGSATLVIGQSDFPFPIPIVQKDNAWTFDTAKGREEILARRIGRNELAAIQACLAYYDAQNEYAEITPKADGMSVYAQRFVSRAGKRDGLYWPAAQGQQPSPVGEAVAIASVSGYKIGSGEPFYGYRYKLLARQGEHAPGGALDYIVDGKMIGGFALIAWPAEYGNSGITTFMVSHSGDVYEKDLGPGTNRVVPRISSFDPDQTWKKVVDTEPVR